MRVAVTGASGHVGGNLVRALLARGDDVRVLVWRDRRALEAIASELEIVEGDIRDPEAVGRLVEGVEVVFHLAACISIIGSQGGKVEDINVNGVRCVVEACLKHKVRRLVHCSSVHAYFQPKEGMTDEDTPIHDEGSHYPTYDRSKAAGEREVRKGIERGLDAVIVNPAAVIGPHDYKPSRVGLVFYNLYHGRLPSLLDGGFDWVDVRDVVSGILAAAARGKTGEKYILSGTYLSLLELSALVREVTGRPVPRLKTPMWLARATAPFAEAISKMLKVEPLYTSEALHALRTPNQFSHDKAVRELGYQVGPIKETITDIYAWFEEMGWLKKGHRHD